MCNLRISGLLYRCVSLILCCIACPLTCQANPEIYRHTLASTVWIVNQDCTGSGVVVDLDLCLVLTNQHVVGDSSQVLVVFPKEKQDNGRLPEMTREYYLRHLTELAFEAEVIATDKDRDLALLKLKRIPAQARAVEIGTSAIPGENIHALGNPGASDALWVYSNGNVRANYYKTFSSGVQHRMQVLETTAPINPGDSGGPIVNNDGQLVAISQSYLQDGRLMSYGVDVSEIRWFISKVCRDNNLQPAASGKAESDKAAPLRTTLNSLLPDSEPDKKQVFENLLRFSTTAADISLKGT